MPGTVFLHRDTDGVITLSPTGARAVRESTAVLGTSVLEVVGGQLSWSLLDGERIPVAVLHDPAPAQDWLWALYGEQVALAVDGGVSGEIPVAPALPGSADDAWRLGYAHWAAQWWPASAIDGIPALDPHLLDQDIAALTDSCEMIVDGPDAIPPQGISQRAATVQQDYALAAGPATAGAPGLLLATGTAGWDWRRCPAGVLDASEHAVSWQLTRDSGRTVLGVRAVAAPRIGRAVPAHLHPHARVVTGSATVDLTLTLAGDAWSGTTVIAADGIASVDVYVPGVGPAPVRSGSPAGDGPEARQRIRDFATSRLRSARDRTDSPGAPLLAEIAAAAADDDF
ncbi:hypothetical protein BJY24_005476 [Nocardia transvalensis]|uniref:Uncharacterized protein n=1 Tax=Nocardia transvalensis TaxID=37333 RepID=A0A7W9UKJ8_9NOCA|nr:hypothetical protein [Nocardia transvalensis]MBB5916564.1 hypothetical protein [Nocardia transvalensis]